MTTHSGTGTGNVQDELNRMAPAARDAKLGSLAVDLINNAANCRMLSAAGLVINGAGATFCKNGAAFAAVASGVVVRKAANTAMAALVGTLATAHSAAWCFYIDQYGNLTSSAMTAPQTTHDLAIAAIPTVTAGLALIGILVVDNATGSNFVGGTTALDTGSLTTTYYNVVGGALPSIPDINSRYS